MNDKDNETTPPVRPQSLDYRNPIHMPATSSVANGFALIGGVILSAGFVLFLGVILAISDVYSAQNSPNSRWLFGILAGFWFGLFVVCRWMIRRIRHRGNQVPASNQLRRFFVLGLLIGCGIGALMEGICFGVGAMS